MYTLNGYTDWMYEERVGEYAAKLAEQHVDNGSEPGELMILSRYVEGARIVDWVKEELEDRAIPYDGKEDEDRYRPSAEDVDPEGSIFSAH